MYKTITGAYKAMSTEKLSQIQCTFMQRYVDQSYCNRCFQSNLPFCKNICIEKHEPEMYGTQYVQ